MLTIDFLFKSWGCKSKFLVLENRRIKFNVIVIRILVLIHLPSHEVGLYLALSGALFYWFNFLLFTWIADLRIDLLSILFQWRFCSCCLIILNWFPKIQHHIILNLLSIYTLAFEYRSGGFLSDFLYNLRMHCVNAITIY